MHATILIIFPCLCHLSLAFLSFKSSYQFHQFLPKKTVNNHNRNKPFIIFNGYLPPEEDPEYSKVIKKSLIRSRPTLEKDQDPSLSFPIPREGDIVLCPGKLTWANEDILGSIRFLRTSFYGNETSWIADISPLSPIGASENMFIIDKKAKSLSVSTALLRPVKNAFIRSENAFKIQRDTNSSEFSLRSPKYRAIDASINLPSKEYNDDILLSQLDDYKDLKNRLIKSTATFGFAVAAVLPFIFSFAVSAYYLLGVGASIVYLFLLGKETDSIGLVYSKSPNAGEESAVFRNLSRLRLAVPAMLLVSLAAFNSLSHSQDLDIGGTLRLVSKTQFLSSMAGFLSYRIALFISEVLTEVRGDDILGILPGSFAEGFRQYNKMQSDSSDQTSMIDVVFVSGPRAAGREFIFDDIFSRNNGSVNGFTRWKFFTSNFELAKSFPQRYTYIGSSIMDDMLRGGGDNFVTSVDFCGNKETVILSLAGLAGESKVAIEGPPDLFDYLQKRSVLKLTPIWLSAQTKEQFVDGARRVILAERAFCDMSPVATSVSELDDEVSYLVDSALVDIGKFKSIAPSFKYTLLTTWFNQNDTQGFFELEEIMKQWRV